MVLVMEALAPQGPYPNDPAALTWLRKSKLLPRSSWAALRVSM